MEENTCEYLLQHLHKSLVNRKEKIIKPDDLQAVSMDCAEHVSSEENGMLLTALPRTVFS